MYHELLPSSVLERDSLIGKKIDDYLVVKKLGEGGFGAVYLALQMPIMMKTALKLLKPMGDAEDAEARIESFKVEARVLAQLAHPNIVRLVEYGILDGVPYMAMEFVEKGMELEEALRQRLAYGTGLSFVEVRHIMTQVLHALAAAHGDGLIHRDLKPQNIMLQRVKGDSSFVRVLDFGLAKFVRESADTSMARGTPCYMAPEQFTGRNIGPWTDLYAAGLIMFELLTGRRAFSDSYSSQLVAKKLNPDHDPTERAKDLNLPESISVFVRRATALDTRNRFRSAREFLAAMTRLFDKLEASGDHSLFQAIGLDGETVSAPTTEVDKAEYGAHDTVSASAPVGAPAGAPERDRFARDAERLTRTAAHMPRRSWWPVAAAVAVALVLAGGLYYYMFGRPEDGRGAEEAVVDGREIPAVPGKPELEFMVNSYTKHDQKVPEVAVFSDNRFVAAWQSTHQDGSGNGIFVQMFNADGTRDGEEIQANSYTTGHQGKPQLVAFPDGRFVVIWPSESQDADGWGVFGQRFTGEGKRERAPFSVNTYTKGHQQLADADSLSGGRFVVVWQSYGQDGDAEGVFGQVFDFGTAKLGPEFQVNSKVGGNQRYPVVAGLADGGFAVVWESLHATGGDHDIFARLLTAAGSPGGQEFQVNSYAKGSQRYPAVASLGDSGIVVLWTSGDQDGFGRGVYGQLLEADGTRRGGEFPVNTTTELDQWVPCVAAFSDGGFVALWMSAGQGESGYGVLGQAYNADGTLKGTEFRLNVFEEGDQRVRSVATFPDGRFIGVWESEGHDGSGWGVYARIARLTDGGSLE